MAQFTLLETVVYHRMLWAELAERGCRKGEVDFWNLHKINRWDVSDFCFACEYNTGCYRCIFDWGTDEEGEPVDCEDEGTPYKNWVYEKNIEDRKKYAALIRDLPLKPEFAKMLGE